MTTDTLIINFGFDNEVPEELNSNITENVVISIPSLNSSLYSYIITKTEDFPYRYNIHLNYLSVIKNRPILFLKLVLSPPLRANDSLIFTKNIVDISVLDYYHISEDTKRDVENSANVFKSSAAGADQVFMGSNLVTPASSFMIKSLVVNQMIKICPN